MKDSVASMISNKAVFTARRPDKAKHQPKVLNEVVSTVKLERPIHVVGKDGCMHVATAQVKKTKVPHTVWRGGREWVVTKGGLIPV
jgi:hypothetical protein